MTDKIFRDPLYNYIALDRKRDGWLLDLLNCPEVQRLRRIHQLGVSNYTYPGADHTRLAHSLGVVHLMQLALRRLEEISDAQKIKNARQALLATALLHDVGHGPFSHLFEPCLGIKHEAWSIEVVKDPTTCVHQVLKNENIYLPAHVADLIDSKDTKHPAWQKALISSQLDVDRLDYLRRDSLFTGAGYGHFDWYRLLTSVEFHNGDTDLVWPEKAVFAIEEYIFARYYMYQNVYLHKTTRGFEQILQAMWRRADQFRKEGKDVNPVPVLDRFWNAEEPKPGKLPVEDYLKIEEFTVLEQIQRWTDHSDKPLSELAKRFLRRNGLAMVEPPPPADPISPLDLGEWETELHKLIKGVGFEEPAMFCLKDTVESKYLQPYREEKEPNNQNAANSIRIRVGNEKPVEIGQHLPRLATVIAPPKDKMRYYVPKEIRKEAQDLSRRLAESRQPKA